MKFQIQALGPAQFAPLFCLSSDALVKAKAHKVIADTNPGYPCRVSLVDAKVGETVLLVNFQHQPAESPFQAAHAIYVRENADLAFPEPGAVPEMFLHRLISVRAFNGRHLITHADVVDGAFLSEAIPAMMNDSNVDYLHLHNAKLGCFSRPSDADVKDSIPTIICRNAKFCYWPRAVIRDR